ncbi:hypothetical protein [Pseudomonas sp. T8]|uniref:hypothetical protein n=1 Tax=Pseudomonas sp. T8 TaxID=645292 RepID=UPI0021497114|nr:hypothetical protein [Pseudomonas sp. T8]UUT22124.1 hypothetical protein NRG23_31290 [Pseudomonas sp. T8]
MAVAKVVRRAEDENLSEKKFTISYDAKESSLSDHEISAKDLGEAILGMHNLIEETASIISNGSADVTLKVTTPAKEGSVEVVFALLADPATALKVLSILGFATPAAAFVGGSLVELVQQIKGKKITSVTIEGDSATAEVMTNDGPIKADKNLAKLITSTKIRDALHKIIQAPLTGKKDAQFKVIGGAELPVVSIKQDAIDDFSRLPKGTLEEISVETEVVRASFAQINFESSKGWRIRKHDGSEFAVTVKDQAFLEKVNKNQKTFQKEDSYNITIETTTTSRPTRATIDRVIVKVQD